MIQHIVIQDVLLNKVLDSLVTYSTGVSVGEPGPWSPNRQEVSRILEFFCHFQMFDAIAEMRKDIFNQWEEGTSQSDHL